MTENPINDADAAVDDATDASGARRVDASAETASGDDDGVISTLDVIESQPVTERAAGYAALHDELARRLDGAGAPASQTRGRP